MEAFRALPSVDRLLGAPEALEFVRKLSFKPSEAAFDAAFSTR